MVMLLPVQRGRCWEVQKGVVLVADLAPPKVANVAPPNVASS